MPSAALIPAGAADVARLMPVLNIEQAIQRRDAIVTATKQLMNEGVDFGTIPGTPKPSLWQPGADKLCNLFGLVIEYEVTESIEDWTGKDHGGEPFFYYQVKGRALRSDYLMGQGVGSCNSWESKYRWRKSERICPSCCKDTIIKGKAEYGGGWLCFAKRGGCGAKFKDGDPAIEGQETGRKPNPDAADTVNTVLKMAYKRCKVATTINATSASEFFTQDIEDFPQFQPSEPAPASPLPEPDPVRDEPPKPSTLDQVLATFGNPKAIKPAFAQLKAHFLQVLDEDAWNRLMEQHGELKTVGTARKAFTAAWKMVEINTPPANETAPEC